MKYSYYPGCTLKNKAKALDDYARACALILGFELEELEYLAVLRRRVPPGRGRDRNEAFLRPGAERRQGKGAGL